MARLLHAKNLFQGQTAAGTKGSASGLGAASKVRVIAVWAGTVTAGVITVRHRLYQGDPYESHPTTLGFINGGGANSVIIDGPVEDVEAEITTVLAGGGTVSARLAAMTG